jgi:hypothetical protein
MRAFAYLLGFAVVLTGVSGYMAHASGDAADGEAAPIFGIKLPPGYRNWRLISVAHEAGNRQGPRRHTGHRR